MKPAHPRPRTACWYLWIADLALWKASSYTRERRQISTSHIWALESVQKSVNRAIRYQSQRAVWGALVAMVLMQCRVSLA